MFPTFACYEAVEEAHDHVRVGNGHDLERELVGVLLLMNIVDRADGMVAHDRERIRHVGVEGVGAQRRRTSQVEVVAPFRGRITT